MCPILFQVGGFTLYAYGFFLGLGLAVAVGLSALKARKEGIHFERIIELFFYTVFSAIVGARALFVLINFDFFRQHPWQVLRFSEGGLVFYGGLALGVPVAVFYLKWNKLPVWRWADLFTPYVALGLAFGRVGCFLAGCCYGKETSLPWGVTFTRPASLARLNVPLHPTQLYEAAACLAIFVFLTWMERRRSFGGQVFWLFVLLYAVTRFVIEMVRDDPRGFIWGGLLSTSQGLGIPLAILSVFMLFYLKRHRRS
jgi:phosphatidylglycerol:prolipoprotein diacylglycerol transferase